MRLRFFAPLGLLMGLILVLGIGLKLDPREVDSPLIGKPAPVFSLPLLGAEGQLSERDLSAAPSLFNVWSSWCVACRQEHPILMELARRGDVRLYGLNYKDAPEDALALLAREGNPYLASGMDRDGQVGIDWGVYGVPETFVVDRAGTIVAKRIGPLSWDYVQQELLPLLKELQQ